MDLFSEDIKVDDLSSAIRLFRESREGFIKLFNNSPVCMSMTTTTLDRRVYVRVNNRFLEKFGYDESEIIGKTSVEIGILDQEESNRVRSLISEKGRLQNDYVKCIAKDGQIVHTVSSIEFMEMNGEVFLVSFFVDITKIIEQQAIIENHVQQLAAVNKELEAFSYSVSHDLRAPLRAINGYAAVLKEDFSGLFDEKGTKLLLAVQQNAQKMNNLIENLLSFAKLGKQPVRKSDVNMNDLTREVLNDLRNTCSANTVIHSENLHPIKGDYPLMRQVMLNLISNAIKYSSKKDYPLIEILSRQEDYFVTFTVRDNGAGFDMKYADKLFGVFQRLHSSSEFEGTGVGLAFVQRIINKHGGTIYAESEPDKGAAFHFKLPA